MRILAVLSILLITSCATFKENRKARKCAKFECIKEAYTFDSVTVKEVHDTSYITREGTTVYLENPCAELCDSLGNLKSFTKETKNNGIKSTIKSVGNSLVVECDTDSLEAVISTLQTTRIRKELQTIEVPRKAKWYEKFLFVSGIIFWLAVLLYIAKRFV